MKNSKIGWTTHTWNPVSGCTQVSPGCDNCYAKAIAEPKRGTPAFPKGFDLTLRPHKLRDPLKWKDPARIFVNSMSDLFHRDIPDDYLVSVWETMLAADHHIYQVLTKRPHRPPTWSGSWSCPCRPTSGSGPRLRPRPSPTTGSRRCSPSTPRCGGYPVSRCWGPWTSPATSWTASAGWSTAASLAGAGAQPTPIGSGRSGTGAWLQGCPTCTSRATTTTLAATGRWTAAPGTNTRYWSIRPWRTNGESTADTP